MILLCRSRVVQEWLGEHEEIQCLFWPARSPDMNVIENMWASLMKEWNSAHERTPVQVERHCHEIWESILRRSTHCQKLVDSMPRRIQNLIQINGGYNKY